MNNGDRKRRSNNKLADSQTGRVTQSRRSLLASLGGLPAAGAVATDTATAQSVTIPPALSNELDYNNYTLHYADGKEDDAQQVRDWLQQAESVLNNDDIYPHEYSLGTDVLLKVDPPSKFVVSAGYYTDDGGLSRGVMNLVSPSVHPYSGEERDRWFTTSVAHEYVHLPQTTDMYRNDVNDVTWFTEGMAEYLANEYVIPAAGFDKDDEKFNDQAIRDGAGYLQSLGHTYSGSDRIFQFLCETYDPATITALSRTDAPTIVNGLQNEVGLHPTEMEREWLEWAQEHIGGDYEMPIFTPEGTNMTTATIRGSTIGARGSASSGQAPGRRQLRPYYRVDVFGPVDTDTATLDGADSDTRQQADSIPAQSTVGRIGPLRSRLETSSENEDSYPNSLDAGKFTIRYKEGYTDDAETVKDWFTTLTAKATDIISLPSEQIPVYLDTNRSRYYSISATASSIEIPPPSSTRDGSFYTQAVIYLAAERFLNRVVSDRLPRKFAEPVWFTYGLGKYLGVQTAREFVEDPRIVQDFKQDVTDGLVHFPQVGTAWGYQERVFESVLNATEDLASTVFESDKDWFASVLKDELGLHPYHVEVVYLQMVNEEYGGTYDISRRVSGEKTVDDYTNESGVVMSSNLEEAITDYRNGLISTQLLRDVMATWETEQSS